MKRMTMMVLAMVAVVGAGGAFQVQAATGQPGKAENRYLRHPFFQNLPPMETRVETQFGYGDSGDLPFGVLGAFGIGLSEAVTVGIYGQLFTSDRDLPNKTSVIYGIGGFGEVYFDLGIAASPYIGLRLGMIDPTGPSTPTLPYVGGYTGLIYPLTEKISISVAVTLHWAGKDGDFEAYNYEHTSNGGYTAESTDITIDT
ncbi:MAG TPA: hypothetical protein DCS43_02110, partial [Verrucomicrobia bacterium]|nr:hypothetical protein [Verrucomicrobiota bacterium]